MEVEVDIGSVTISANGNQFNNGAPSENIMRQVYYKIQNYSNCTLHFAF